MCLYPTFVKNKKYIANKKNGGNPPRMRDARLKYVAVGCGNCIECRQQKAREWQTRLHEELKANVNACFATLSLSPQAIKDIMKENESITTVNDLATKAVRLFLERWRKKYKKSLRHWFVTELGETNTERIHLHGILWTDKVQEIEEKWKYGNVYIGEYCSSRTINYIVKYILKIDEVHPDYKPIVLASPGLGGKYCEDQTGIHTYRPQKTVEYYTLENGNRIALPIYYRNKLFTEREREQLWLEKLDQQRIFVRGYEFDISTKDGERKYYNFLKEQQRKNEELGYKGREWKLKDYDITVKMLMTNKQLRAYEKTHTRKKQ